MYRFLWQKSTQLLAPQGPLALWAHQQVRFVLRPTRIYYDILERLLHPNFLQDGLTRSIELDVLSQGYTKADSDTRFWAMLKVEIDALEQVDIPYFQANVSSDALPVNAAQSIKRCFVEPSYDRVVTRLANMNNTDLQRQITLIRGALLCRQITSGHTPPPSKAPYPSTDTPTVFATETVLHQATQIAAQIRDQAIRSPTGGASWITPVFNLQADRFQLQPMDVDLYGGIGGIGLFLAALAQVSAKEADRNLALAAFQTIREVCQQDQACNSLAARVGIGGASGLGSVIYALVRGGELLGEDGLLADARRLADLITPDRIRSDRAYDVVAGSAGAILGLKALYDSCGDDAVLGPMVDCGQYLLERRTRGQQQAGPRAWATMDNIMLTGFSHGAAGIAYALLRLYQATKDSSFAAAAAEAMAYERSLFSAAAGNWPDLRSSIDGKDRQLSYATAWCHGAAGIGLARLGGLPIQETPEVLAEIEVALKTMGKLGLGTRDHLCCGNLGATELFFGRRRDFRAADTVGCRPTTGRKRNRSGRQKRQFPPSYLPFSKALCLGLLPGVRRHRLPTVAPCFSGSLAIYTAVGVAPWPCSFPQISCYFAPLSCSCLEWPRPHTPTTELLPLPSR